MSVITEYIMPATLEYIIAVTWQRLNPKPHWLRILHWVLLSPMTIRQVVMAQRGAGSWHYCRRRKGINILNTNSI
jgi:hypothetical protein